MDRTIQPERKKLNSIQILRGLAAGAVLVAHVIEHPRTEPVGDANAIVMLGVFGVQLFFVISGFIIAFVNSDGQFEPGRFLVRRVFRVVPLYWLCTATVFVCALYLPFLFKSTVADTGYFLKSLVFIPAAMPNDPSDWRPLFKLGWSLNYEIFFYLAFALFWWCRSALQRTMLLTVILGSFVAGSLFVEPSASIAAFYLHNNLLTFICGLWIAEAEKRGLWERLPDWAVAAFGLTALVFLYVTFTLPLRSFQALLVYSIMCIAAVLLVITALACERFCSKLSGRHPLVALGEISYSLYLTHMFVVGFGWAILKRLQPGPALEIAGIIGIVVGSVIAARISWWLVEMPGNQLGHQLTRKRPRRIAVPAE